MRVKHLTASSSLFSFILILSSASVVVVGEEDSQKLGLIVRGRKGPVKIIQPKALPNHHHHHVKLKNYNGSSIISPIKENFESIKGLNFKGRKDQGIPSMDHLYWFQTQSSLENPTPLKCNNHLVKSSRASSLNSNISSSSLTKTISIETDTTTTNNGNTMTIVSPPITSTVTIIMVEELAIINTPISAVTTTLDTILMAKRTKVLEFPPSPPTISTSTLEPPPLLLPVQEEESFVDTKTFCNTINQPSSTDLDSFQKDPSSITIKKGFTIDNSNTIDSPEDNNIHSQHDNNSLEEKEDDNSSFSSDSEGWDSFSTDSDTDSDTDGDNDNDSNDSAEDHDNSSSSYSSIKSNDDCKVKQKETTHPGRNSKTSFKTLLKKVKTPSY